MGLEPTISCLEGKRSATELRPRASYSTVTGTDGQPVFRGLSGLSKNLVYDVIARTPVPVLRGKPEAISPFRHERWQWIDPLALAPVLVQVQALSLCGSSL